MNSLCKSLLLIRTFVLAASFALFTHIGLGQVSSGSGTAGKIPVWTGAHSQGDSVITQSGNNIGIGTAAPTALLSVNSGSASPAILARDTVNGPAVWGVGNTGFGLRGDSTSYVGVGGFSTNLVGVWGSGPVFGVVGTSAAGTAVYGSASTEGDGVFGTSLNGRGVYGRSTNNFGVFGEGTSSYGGYFTSSAYRAGYFKSFSNVKYSLFVDSQDGPTQATAALNVVGTIRGEGNLVIAGSKAGYVVDEMQNADSVNLEPGDVVVIAEDSSAPVLGKIPVPRIKLAANANDTAVVGVVDQIIYVPDEATRNAYEAQQQADHEAATRSRNDIESKHEPIVDMQNRISDEAGTLHPDSYATSASPGGYCSVVTLGAYKAVKADASFGAIRAGDLLTTGSHAGYTMRVTDKAAASGAIIGKALSSLDKGIGTVTVMVTLK
jgi:hypothetical protein